MVYALKSAFAVTYSVSISSKRNCYPIHCHLCTLPYGKLCAIMRARECTCDVVSIQVRGQKPIEEAPDMEHDTTRDTPNAIPLCACGCGLPTTTYVTSNRRLGIVANVTHHRFAANHNGVYQEAENVLPRLWSHISRGAPDACWEWQAFRNKAGYGKTSIHSKPAMAHRAIWQTLHGPIPEGIEVLHSCDNPPCCNPDHLFLGTQLDNVHDMVLKKRNNPGTWTPDRRNAQRERMRHVGRSYQASRRKAYRARLTA
jgi:hypothetical protein